MVHFSTEKRFRTIEFCAHTWILRTLTRKHEHDRGDPQFLTMCIHSFRISRIEHRSPLPCILTSHNPSMNKFGSASLQCKLCVSQFHFRFAAFNTVHHASQMSR